MGVQVETATGRVDGVSAAGISVFKGIPFAAPPLGVLRWQPPQPALPWTGSRDCTQFGPISPQNPDPLIAVIPGCAGIFSHPGAVQDEDCLSVNVWSPSLGNASRLPVYVWIHGGAFLGGAGSSPWTDGTNLAHDEGIVVVSLNYRLGALGGAALGGTTGNNLLLDQVAALEWVRDNITAFGGDPQRVTVGGESAGAISVAALLCAPAARGLCAQAVMQSGHGGLTLSRAESERMTRAYLAELGLRADDREALASVTTDRILAAQRALTDRAAVPFRTVIDGTVLPEPLPDMVAAGKQAAVPLLLGTQTDENNLFAEMGWGPGADGGGSLRGNIAAMFADPDGAAVDELVQQYLEAEGDAAAAWQAASTDRDWRIPARTFADGHAAAGNAVFAYEFTYRSSARGGRLGACHALDIPFPFGNLDADGVGELAGIDVEGEAVRRRLERACRQAWGAFIRDGAPSSELLPTWDTYDDAKRPVMSLGEEFEISYDPRGARLAALEALQPLETMRP
jgi:para-nitrobenzyl esterase